MGVAGQISSLALILSAPSINFQDFMGKFSLLITSTTMRIIFVVNSLFNSETSR